MKQEYKELFDSLQKDKEELSLNSRVLLVDGLNTFIRSFAVIRHVNKNLTPIGGLTGFLRSLGYAINLIRPTRVMIVFDGVGSSTNKRYLYPEYKANRGIRRITDWDHFDNQEEESESIKSQVVRLAHYLRCLPVDILSIDKIEADDVIGYISSKIGDHVTIMSSDRDYLQLVSDRVTVYSPTKKKFYTPKTVLSEYKVTPHNFLTQKVLLGDSGDNVPGVMGLGPKTMLKEFPELGTNETVELEQVLEKCEVGSKRVHQRILEYKHQLFINRLLMDLKNPNVHEEALQEIHYALENPYKEFNTLAFVKLYEEDDLQNSIPNLQNWLLTNFYAIQKYYK